MDKEIFENALRYYIRSEPFFPFIVELNTGEEIVIGQPGVVFNDGSAGFINPEPRLVEFSHDEVRAIRLMVKEPYQ
jgi:hypothetical protein